MGPTWGRQDLGGPHVGPMNFALWAVTAMEPSGHCGNVTRASWRLKSPAFSLFVQRIIHANVNVIVHRSVQPDDDKDNDATQYKPVLQAAW